MLSMLNVTEGSLCCVHAKLGRKGIYFYRDKAAPCACTHSDHGHVHQMQISATTHRLTSKDTTNVSNFRTDSLVQISRRFDNKKAPKSNKIDKKMFKITLGHYIPGKTQKRLHKVDKLKRKSMKFVQTNYEYKFKEKKRLVQVDYFL